MNEQIGALQATIHQTQAESGEIDPHFGAALSDAQMHFLLNPEDTANPASVLRAYFKTERNSRLRPSPTIKEDN